MPGATCEAVAEAIEQGRSRCVYLEPRVKEELGCPVGTVIGGRSKLQLLGAEAQQRPPRKAGMQ